MNTITVDGRSDEPDDVAVILSDADFDVALDDGARERIVACHLFIASYPTL
jgi:hypothetical protein